MRWKAVDKRGPIHTVVTPLEMEQVYRTYEQRWLVRCSCKRYPGEWCNSVLREVRDRRDR